MEIQIIKQYKHYENSVGNNLQSIQITTKYRYEMMKSDLLKVDCKVAIEEACKKHGIKIIDGVGAKIQSSSELIEKAEKSKKISL